jgi:hypothetical protein
VVGRERRVTRVRPALRIACCHDHAWPEHVIIKEGRSERIGSVLSRNLGGRVNGGCRIVDRSRVSDRLTRSTRSSDRLGANSGPPVAAKPESLEASEQTAMLLGSAGGLANRGRRGTGRSHNHRAGGWCTHRHRAGGWCTHRHRAGGWCTGTPLLVASLSIASQNQRPDQSAQNQSQ